MEDFAVADRLLQFADHRAVLFVALVAAQLHIFQLLLWDRLWRLLQLRLQLHQTLLQALLFCAVGSEQAGLQTSETTLVIQHQQGFR
ncbi:hypothetical protein D3C79_963310 [compost metagenome]